MGTACWLDEFGCRDADITAISNRRIVTPLGGASLMLRLTLLIGEPGVGFGGCRDIGPPPGWPPGMLARVGRRDADMAPVHFKMRGSRRGLSIVPDLLGSFSQTSWCGRGTPADRRPLLSDTTFQIRRALPSRDRKLHSGRFAHGSNEAWMSES